MIVRLAGQTFLLAMVGAATCMAQGFSGAANLSTPASTSPLFESVPDRKGNTSSRLSLKDAVDRAIRNNLATLYADENERIATAKRFTELAALYPKIDGRIAIEQHQVNLAAFGFSGFPGVREVIGPYGLVDFRASFTQAVIDRERKHNVKAAAGYERAAALNTDNTRELVAFVVTDLYLQALSSTSRVSAVEAQLTRAKALHSRALDLKAAGLVPGIDVVRAEVEVRTGEKRLVQARNAVAKQKLMLARAVGMPLDLDIVLTDRLPEETSVNLTIAALLDQAYERRADAKALDASVAAAEEALRAVRAKDQATVGVRADYGVIGKNPASSHGTYTIGVDVRIPLFDRKTESEASEKMALLRERQAERDSLHGRIEFETRSALLDVQSASEELQAARRALDLARQQLDQAQDRFSAGVSDNLEVIQAQETLALADEAVIQSLYAFNVARAFLSRATGSAERSVPEFSGRSSK